jgi:hypothetical protein
MIKARVGLILDDKSQSWNIYDLIERSFKSDVYEIACIVVQENNNAKCKKFFKYINEYCFKLISFFERIFVKRFMNTDTFFKKYPISLFNIKKISVKPIVSKSGFVHKFSKEDLKKI